LIANIKTLLQGLHAKRVRDIPQIFLSRQKMRPNQKTAKKGVNEMS